MGTIVKGNNISNCQIDVLGLGITCKDDTSDADWKKDINQVQQMYIAQQYQAENGMDLDEDVKSIEGNQLKSLKKKAKKVEKNLKKSWEVYTVQRVGPKQMREILDIALPEA